MSNQSSPATLNSAMMSSSLVESQFDGGFTLDGVSVAFAGQIITTALQSCTLSVESGEFVSIVGPSGSGKSTLLNVIGLLQPPTTGSYRMGVADVSLMSDTERSRLRRSLLGFVFQSFHLLPHQTAQQNVELALSISGVSGRGRRRRAAAQLDRVGLLHRASARASTLSGGERQRVAIARALVREPPLLLCDEPTGNLDSRAVETVLSLLAELNSEGRTIIVVTHDREVAASAQRTVRMADGVVVPVAIGDSQ